jgi:hypothetical protein
MNDLDAIRELKRAVENPRLTAGPWAAWYSEPLGSNQWHDRAAVAGLPIHSVDRCPAFMMADAAFIAASRTGVPALFALVERMQPYLQHSINCPDGPYRACTCGKSALDAELSALLAKGGEG